MSALPKGSVANVYQSIDTAAAIMDGGSPVVLSPYHSGWYLETWPTFEKVYSVRPCDALECDAHPHRRRLLLGGSVCAWGEHLHAANYDAGVLTGMAALAERLWSDPPLVPNASAAARDAEERHHALACHWAMWGVSTHTRLADGSTFTAVADPYSHVTKFPAGRGGGHILTNLCPADWDEPVEM